MSRYKIFIAIGILLGVTATVYAFRSLKLTEQVSAGTTETEFEAKNFGLLLQDDALNEFRKIFSNYEGDFDTNGFISLYKDDESEPPLEKTSFLFRKRNSDFYSRVDSVDIVKTGANTLTIDRNAGMILLNSYDGNLQIGMMALDSLWNVMQNTEARVNIFLNNGVKLLRIENIGDPSIYAIRIYYRPDTYEITRIAYDMMQSAISGLDIIDHVEVNTEEDSILSNPVIDTTGERISITAPYTMYIMEVKFGVLKKEQLEITDMPVIDDYLIFNNGEAVLRDKFKKFEFFNTTIESKQE